LTPFGGWEREKPSLFRPLKTIPTALPLLPPPPHPDSTIPPPSHSSVCIFVKFKLAWTAPVPDQYVTNSLYFSVALGNTDPFYFFLCNLFFHLPSQNDSLLKVKLNFWYEYLRSVLEFRIRC
jgi:hypothetical protein